MTNEPTGGVSKRSLVLLGAFAALALNRDVRRSLVQGTRGAVNSTRDTLYTAQGSLSDTLQSTVKPALETAAQQAGETLGHLREGAGQTIGTIREEAPGRAQSLLGSAQEMAGTFAAAAAAKAAQARKDAEKAAKKAQKEYGPRLNAGLDDLRDTAAQARKDAEKAAKKAQKEYGSRLSAGLEDLRDVADDRRHDARKALKQARKSGASMLGDLSSRASSLLDDATDVLDEQREDIEYRVHRARRKAEKDLRRSGKNWNAKKLQKAIDRQVAPIQKEASRQLALLDRQHGRKRSTARAAAGGTGGTLLVVSAGAIALARLPQARQAIMDAVSTVSPETADKLHGVGQQIHGVVGDLWLQREDAALGTQASDPQFSGASSYTVVKPEEKKESPDTTPKTTGADKRGAPTHNN